MTTIRIQQAVDVIRHAIENGISVRQASVECGYADTYVKNVKANLLEGYDNGVVSEQDYNFFMNTYKLYEGSKEKIENDPDIDITKPIENEQFKTEKRGDELIIDWINGQPNEDEEPNINEESENSEEPFYGYPPNHIKTLEELLEAANVDLEIWQVKDYLVNKWDVTSWKRGYPETWQNFQVKVRLEKLKEEYEIRQASEVFKEIMEEYTNSVELPYLDKIYFEFEPDENNLLEIDLFDLHFGKLAWAGETGENFDTKIARARYLDTLANVLKRASGFSYNRILFPIGNDFFNADNLNNTTTAGTPQDEDLRWQKTFKMGTLLLYSAIDMLKQTGVPVDVVIIPGNHDVERSFYLGSVLEAKYGDDELVTIDNGASPRKYYQFGQVLLGLTHGKYEKENALPLLMATEAKREWGETMFHEWHLGHFHKKRNIQFAVFDKAQVLNEELGVTVRYLSSLTGTEKWHHQRGFVGPHKAGEAFIWNDETGLIAHLNANFVDFDREL